MTMKYSSPYQAHMLLMLHNTITPYNNIYISEFDKLSYLFLDAKLWNGTSLGGALGAEDLTTASAMMLPGHHSKLKKNYIIQHDHVLDLENAPRSGLLGMQMRVARLM